MKRILIAPMLFIFASHQASGQDESSKRAYLGVGVQPGALVGNVDNNGPAQAAGIEPGDFIVRFDGKEIRSADELTRIVADTPIGKEVVVTVMHRGREGTTTVKLGQRLVLSGTALDAYRHKLDGMLQELRSLGASKGSWDQPELQRFSKLFEQFEELRKTVPPDDTAVQKLWGQLEREFRFYKSLADNISRQREGSRSTEPGRRIEEQLGPIYLNYMILQVCAARFQQFDNAKSALRELLRNKEVEFPRESTDKLWNAIAEEFRKFESALDQAGNVQLYAECEQASNQAADLIMTWMAEQTQGPPLRKKDF
jgi:PDZ domain